MVASANNDMVVVLDINITDDLKEEFFINQVVNYVQRLRKASGVRKGDDIEIYYSPANKKLDDFLSKTEKAIQAATKRPFLHVSHRPSWIHPLGSDVGTVNGVKITFSVSAPAWCAYVPSADEV